MMRLIVTIVAMFFGLLGFTPQAEATVEMPLKVHAHTYNASSYGAPDNYTAPERGPPVKGYANTTYDAVDLRSHGTSASQSGFGLRAIYDYADAALPVQSGVVADVTNGPARVHIGEASAFGRLQVAANAGARMPGVIRAGELKLPGVPKGATGTVTKNGEGLTYAIPRGTPELDPRVTQIRIMNPTTGKNAYPNGYAVYMNAAEQRVNPLTGQMIHDLSDPFAHIPLP